MKPANENDIFLNGKAQIFEMLRYMNQNERNKLIQNIKARSPGLAEELSEHGLDLDALARLERPELLLVLEKVDPQIMGLAVKAASEPLQRKVLGEARRVYAEKAYTIMIAQDLGVGRDTLERARKKVVDTLRTLVKKGIVNLR